MAERVIWLMIRVRWSISRPGARAVVTGAPAHAVLRHVDGFEDTTGTRFWMSTRRFGRRKSIPDVAAPGADRPRRGHGLRAVSSALWAWLDPPRRLRPPSSTILMPEPTMYWFRPSETSTRSLTNSNSWHRTRRRDLALSHIQKLLHCAAIDAAQMSSPRTTYDVVSTVRRTRRG
jgi:hypothetical protein